MNTISRSYRSVKFPAAPLLLASLLLFAAAAVRAADKEPPAEATPPAAAQSGTQIWLTSGFLSRHFERDAGYNERNTGLGMEVRFDPNHTVAAGFYKNSVRRTTHYIQYAYTPWHWGPVRFGGTVGVLDGYPELRNGKAALAIMPVAAVDFKVLGKDAGLNIVYIPTIAKRVDGAIALQLKIRVH